ncbi:hypothetical protein BN129_342 [Cronobacter sakazakii 701]|nr:hypothetical protein BN129_342 [Cronobacter sakazakii 701]
MPELLPKRLIKAELVAHHTNDLSVGLRPGDEARWIARQQMNEQKHQHRHDEQRRDEPQQAFYDVAKHAKPCFPS